MLWRVPYDLEALQDMSARLLNTGLGKHLTIPYSYLGMTRRSIYVDELVQEDPDGHRSRLQVVPGGSKYIFMVPFIKGRPGYALNDRARGEGMKEHIALAINTSR